MQPLDPGKQPDPLRRQSDPASCDEDVTDPAPDQDPSDPPFGGEGGEHDHVTDLPDGVWEAAGQYAGGYLYVPDRLVVVQEHLGELLTALRGRNLEAKVLPEPDGGKGYAMVEIAEQVRDGVPLVPELVSRLRREDADAGVPALDVYPEHVLGGCNHARPFPSGYPSPADALPAPDPTDVRGRGVTVAVLDGGVDPQLPWFAGRVRVLSGDDVEAPPADGARLDPGAGHGNHVAGLVLQCAPAASVLAVRVLGRAAYTSDSRIAAGIDRLLRALPEDLAVVNLSLGGYCHDNLALPLTTAALRTLLDARPDVAVVASAGNDGLTRPMWPAALKDVIGVGALDASGAVACFSNRGPWVDAATEGIALVSAYLTGKALLPATLPDPVPARCGPVPLPAAADFAATAAWSGTSGAAACVSGTVAAGVAAAGSGRAAAQALLRAAAQVPGLGRRVATLR